MTTKWTADELLEKVRGFQAACIITAGADLDLFTALSDKPITAGFGARVQQVRKHRKMTQAGLAVGVNRHPNTVARIERA